RWIDSAVKKERGQVWKNERMMSRRRRSRRTGGDARPLLLAAVGRRASHPASLWHHAESDRETAGAGRIGNAERSPTRILFYDPFRRRAAFSTKENHHARRSDPR